MFHVWRREGGRHKELSHQSVFFISVLGASCQQQPKSLLRLINNGTENLLSHYALKGVCDVDFCLLSQLKVKGGRGEVLALVSGPMGEFRGTTGSYYVILNASWCRKLARAL